MAKAAPSFEDAMRRLDEIVQAIEQGKVGLEDSLRQFEEGMGLIKLCRTVLAEAELKVQRLQAAGADGVEVIGEGLPAEQPGDRRTPKTGTTESSA